MSQILADAKKNDFTLQWTSGCKSPAEEADQTLNTAAYSKRNKPASMEQSVLREMICQSQIKHLSLFALFPEHFYT